MWMIEPALMCNKHLIGEHGELHKFLHNWIKKHKIDGRIKGNAIEPLSYKSRHEALSIEMLRRGMNHKSPLEQPNFDYLPDYQKQYIVDIKVNEILISERCEDCRQRLNR